MHPGRIGSIVGFAKRMRMKNKEKKYDVNGKLIPQRRKSEEELINLQKTRAKKFEDADLWENSETKIRFRKYPWPYWILATLFLGGAGFIIFMEQENLVKFKKKNHEYILLACLIIVGMAFLVTGKVKSTIFDKKAKKLTIRKRSITCHCRSITNYNLENLKGLRAVKRGIKQG